MQKRRSCDPTIPDTIDLADIAEAFLRAGIDSKILWDAAHRAGEHPLAKGLAEPAMPWDAPVTDPYSDILFDIACTLDEFKADDGLL